MTATAFVGIGQRGSIMSQHTRIKGQTAQAIIMVIFSMTIIIGMVGVAMVQIARADNLSCINPQAGCTETSCTDSPGQCTDSDNDVVDYANYDVSPVRLGNCDDGGVGCNARFQNSCLVNYYTYNLGDDGCGEVVCQASIKENGCTNWIAP